MVHGRMIKEWRCPFCGALLGRDNGTTLKLRYKQAQYEVPSGAKIETDCRSCGEHVKHT